MLVTVRFAVSALVGTRASLLVMFSGRIVLTYGVFGAVGALLVTYTSMRQRPPMAIVPPVREIELVPGAAVKVAAPQPVNAGAGAGGLLLMITPAGSGSVTEKLVRAVSPGAKISILSLELLPAVMEAGVNDFVPVTSVPLITFTLAVAAVRLLIP